MSRNDSSGKYTKPAIKTLALSAAAPILAGSAKAKTSDETDDWYQLSKGIVFDWDDDDDKRC